MEPGLRPLLTAIVAFSCTFGGALAGIRLRSLLPEHHLDADTRSTVTIGVGLIATMTALVLGLVTASAKSSFDALDTAVKHTSSEVLSLDRVLARYGSETGPIRAGLAAGIAKRVDEIWPPDGSPPKLDPASAAAGFEQLVMQVRHLNPQNQDQTWLQERAEDLCETLLADRWVVVAALGTSIPRPFLAILLFWLTITFASFGLFAPKNATATTVLLLCAVSVAAAVFLVLEMDAPFDGLIRVSAEPLRYAVAHVDR